MNNSINLGELPVCSEAITLPINAISTGTWAFMTTFNGAYQYVQFEAEQDQPLIVPAKLNEDYTYTFKLYQPNNDVFNDAVYTVKTIPMLPDIDYVCPNVAGDTNVVSGKVQATAIDGQTEIVSVKLTNAINVAVFVEGAMRQEGESNDEYYFDKLNSKVVFNEPLLEQQKITILYFK